MTSPILHKSWESHGITSGKSVTEAWFTVELLVNMLGQGWDFLFGPNRTWNIFDVLLIANAQLGCNRLQQA